MRRKQKKESDVVDKLILGVCGGMVLDPDEDGDDENETLSYTADSITQPPWHHGRFQNRSRREDRYASSRPRGRKEPRYPVEEEYRRAYEPKRPTTARTGHSRIMVERGSKYPSPAPKYQTGHSKYYHDRKDSSPVPYHEEHSPYFYEEDYERRDDSRYRTSHRYIDDDYEVDYREPYAQQSRDRAQDHYHRSRGGNSYRHGGSRSASTKKRSKFRLFGGGRR